MGHVRLPRNTTLSAERGSWVLRWSEELIGMVGTAHESSQKLTTIGSTNGPEVIGELEARRLARRYLLSRMPPGEAARRSLTTIAEFMETRFFPDLIAPKSPAWRAHYHSILRHILSPEDVQRLFGIGGSRFDTKRAKQPDWPYLGPLRLRDVRAHHVRTLMKAALETGYSPETVRHIRNVVSAVFTYAKQELVFTGTNPARCARMEEIQRKSSPGLTLEQMEQALRAMRYPEKQMAMITLLTDMNVSEICGLQWKHVNLTGAPLEQDGERIPPIAIAVKNKWYRGELANVKQNRRRNIRIPETLLPMLLLLRARPGFTGPEDFVFTSRSGTAINVSNLTDRRLGLIGQSLGIPELTLQALRRAQGLIEQSHESQFQHRIGAAARLDHGVHLPPGERNHLESRDGVSQPKDILARCDDSVDLSNHARSITELSG